MLLASETCLDNTFSGQIVRSDHKTVTDICMSVTIMWLIVLYSSSLCSLICRQEDVQKNRLSEESCMNHQLPSVTVLKVFYSSELSSAHVSPANMAIQPPWSFFCAVETLSHHPLPSSWLPEKESHKWRIFFSFHFFFFFNIKLLFWSRLAANHFYISV